MNKQQFMNQLAAELRKLPREEIQAAMQYYSEYFDEAGPENEQQVIRELGSPGKIATQIKADYAVKQLDIENGRQTTKSGLTAALWVILGIFAAPIALPLAIALGAVAIALFVTIFAIAVTIIVCLGAACLTGIAMIIAGICGLFSSGAAGIMLIGIGLIGAGVAAVLCVFVAIGAKKLMHYIMRRMRGYSENRKVKQLPKEGTRHE